VTGPPAPEGPPLKAFRVLAGTTVIDLPFLPPPGARVRAATLWPDPANPTGWGAAPWEPGPAGRGFTPVAVELGDVVGFAADLPAPPPPQINPANPFQHPPAHPLAPRPAAAVVTWYGYLHAVDADRLLLRGPYHRPEHAYTAAQHALHAHLRAAPDHTAGPGRGQPGGARLAGTDPVPVELAQPPAAVTVTHHGGTATVGDPRHGWIHTDADRLAAALTHTPAELHALLDGHVPGGLGGAESRLTLAALAARHTPHLLADVTAPTPAAPRRPPPLHPPHPTPRPKPADPADPADPDTPPPVGPADPDPPQADPPPAPPSAPTASPPAAGHTEPPADPAPPHAPETPPDAPPPSPPTPDSPAMDL
jgi:hypothetical protein